MAHRRLLIQIDLRCADVHKSLNCRCSEGNEIESPRPFKLWLAACEFASCNKIKAHINKFNSHTTKKQKQWSSFIDELLTRSIYSQRNSIKEIALPVIKQQFLADCMKRKLFLLRIVVLTLSAIAHDFMSIIFVVNFYRIINWLQCGRYISLYRDAAKKKQFIRSQSIYVLCFSAGCTRRFNKCPCRMVW